MKPDFRDVMIRSLLTTFFVEVHMVTHCGALSGMGTTSVVVLIAPDGEWCLHSYTVDGETVDGEGEARARYADRLMGRPSDPEAPTGIVSASQMRAASQFYAEVSVRDGGRCEAAVRAALTAGPNTVEWLAAEGAVIWALSGTQRS